VYRPRGTHGQLRYQQVPGGYLYDSVVIDLDAALIGAAATSASDQADWLSRHATLLVGVVGILVSGLVGPSVAAAWTGRRERERDHRTLISARRDDLRDVIDQAAELLASAIPNIKKLMSASAMGEQLPETPRDLLSQMIPLSQRIQLRLPPDHRVVISFEAAREALLALSKSTESQEEFDRAADSFEEKRTAFLHASRTALQGKISRKVEI
jgi:hypothetical protein